MTDNRSIASVPASACGRAEDAKWSRGMAMSMKKKLLFVWILVVVLFSILFRHFWAITVYALSKAIVLNHVSLPGFAKFAAGICGMHFLP
jgi:hypothetical protein